PGIGVQERDNNRHVLLSLQALESWITPDNWTEDAGDIVVNSLSWASGGATFECVVLDGGMLVGNVTEQDDGRGGNGATVASVGAPDDATKTFATPDDSNLDDGFYFLFSSLTGDQEFTASAAKYHPATQTVDVVADGTVEADFSLSAGHLVVEPGAV